MEFDAYRDWLQIPADRRPPDFYDLLGLPRFESDADRIRAASMRRSAEVRRFCLGAHGADANRLLGELAAAFACLADPARKAAYDESLGGRTVEAVSATSAMSADADAPPVQWKIPGEQSRSDKADAAAQAAGKSADRAVAAPRTTARLSRRRNVTRRARQRAAVRGTALILALPIMLAALVVAVQFHQRAEHVSGADAKPPVETSERRPNAEFPLQNAQPAPAPADAARASAPPADVVAETGMAGEGASESPAEKPRSQSAPPKFQFAGPASPAATDELSPEAAEKPPAGETQSETPLAATQPLPLDPAGARQPPADAVPKPATPAEDAAPAKRDPQRNEEQTALLSEVQHWLDRADEEMREGTVHGARKAAFHLGEAIRAAKYEVNDKTEEAARRLAECLKLIRDNRTGAGPVAAQITKEADATLSKFRRFQQRAAAARAVTEN